MKHTNGKWLTLGNCPLYVYAVVNKPHTTVQCYPGITQNFKCRKLTQTLSDVQLLNPLKGKEKQVCPKRKSSARTALYRNEFIVL